MVLNGSHYGQESQECPRTYNRYSTQYIGNFFSRLGKRTNGTPQAEATAPACILAHARNGLHDLQASWTIARASAGFGMRLAIACALFCSRLLLSTVYRARGTGDSDIDGTNRLAAACCAEFGVPLLAGRSWAGRTALPAAWLTLADAKIWEALERRSARHSEIHFFFNAGRLHLQYDPGSTPAGMSMLV